MSGTTYTTSSAATIPIPTGLHQLQALWGQAPAHKPTAGTSVLVITAKGFVAGTDSYSDGPFVQHSLTPQSFGAWYKVFSPGFLRGGGLSEVWVLERKIHWLKVK